MKTIYDLLTLALFAGLVVLFLQRSASEATPDDHLYQYLPPAILLAAANYFGNHDQDIVAIVGIVAAVAYVLVVLKPFKQRL